MKRNKVVALCALTAVSLLIVALIVVFFPKEKVAKIINDNAADAVNRDFYDSHYVSGVYYDSALSVSDDSEYPASRTFLISSEEEYEEIFSSAADPAIDFQSRMIVVYSFADIYKRPLVIKKISASENSITIVLSHKKAPAGVGDACLPYQRYVVIELSGNNYSDISISVED